MSKKPGATGRRSADVRVGPERGRAAVPKIRTITEAPSSSVETPPDPPQDGDRGHRRRSNLIALGVLAVAILLLGAGVVSLRGSAGSGLVVTAGENVAVSQDAVSINAHNSPIIVRHPSDPDRLVVAGRIDSPGFSAAVHTSDDAGATWRDVDFPTPVGEDRPYAPDLAWTPDGRLHLAFVTLTGAGNNPEAVWLTSSDDAGATWAKPQKIVGSYAFQVRLAADPSDGDLYLTWLQAERNAVGTNSFTVTGLPIQSSRSADGGHSWSDPVRVNTEGRARVGAAVPVVAEDGTLYVAYTDFKDDRRDWQDLEGPPHDGPFELVVARSTDDGRQFTESVAEPSVQPFRRFLIYQPAFPGLAVAADGSVYVSWSSALDDAAEVFVRRSDDGGVNWTAPVQVNDSKVADGVWRYLPQIAVAPNGRVDVTYLERRDAEAAALFATSTDRGRTWSNIAVSEIIFDARIGPLAHRRTQEADLGSRLALVSDDDGVLAAWVDTRRGREATAKQDIYLAPVRITSR